MEDSQVISQTQCLVSLSTEGSIIPFTPGDVYICASESTNPRDLWCLVVLHKRNFPRKYSMIWQLTKITIRKRANKICFIVIEFDSTNQVKLKDFIVDPSGFARILDFCYEHKSDPELIDKLQSNRIPENAQNGSTPCNTTPSTTAVNISPDSSSWGSTLDNYEEHSVSSLCSLESAEFVDRNILRRTCFGSSLRVHDAGCITPPVRNIASIEERRVINEADVDDIPEKLPSATSNKILPVSRAELLAMQGPVVKGRHIQRVKEERGSRSLGDSPVQIILNGDVIDSEVLSTCSSRLSSSSPPSLHDSQGSTPPRQFYVSASEPNTCVAELVISSQSPNKSRRDKVNNTYPGLAPSSTPSYLQNFPDVKRKSKRKTYPSGYQGSVESMQQSLDKKNKVFNTKSLALQDHALHTNALLPSNKEITRDMTSRVSERRRILSDNTSSSTAGNVRCKRPRVNAIHSRRNRLRSSPIIPDRRFSSYLQRVQNSLENEFGGSNRNTNTFAFNDDDANPPPPPIRDIMTRDIEAREIETRDLGTRDEPSAIETHNIETSVIDMNVMETHEVETHEVEACNEESARQIDTAETRVSVTRAPSPRQQEVTLSPRQQQVTLSPRQQQVTSEEIVEYEVTDDQIVYSENDMTATILDGPIMDSDHVTEHVLTSQSVEEGYHTVKSELMLGEETISDQGEPPPVQSEPTPQVKREESGATETRSLRARRTETADTASDADTTTTNTTTGTTKTKCYSGLGLAKPHGFINLGNTCYMNCVLQCVLTVPSFKSILNTPYNPIKPTLLSCISSLMKHKSVNGSTKEKRELLTRVKKFISDATSLFKGSRQQDAHEFLGKLLDVLREERHSSLKCPVSRTFQCEVVHTLRCMSCSAGGQKMEQYYDFSLNLPTRSNSKKVSTHSLAELLDSYFAPDQVELRCTVCGHDTAHVQHRFNRLPQTLVLHVQRYSFSRNGGREEKRQDNVSIPTRLDITKLSKNISSKDTLLDKNYKRVSIPDNSPIPVPCHNLRTRTKGIYSLHAVISHLGESRECGHYICDVQEAGEWYFYDDVNMHRVDLSYVRAKRKNSCYLFFYLREDNLLEG